MHKFVAIIIGSAYLFTSRDSVAIYATYYVRRRKRASLCLHQHQRQIRQAVRGARADSFQNVPRIHVCMCRTCLYQRKEEKTSLEMPRFRSSEIPIISIRIVLSWSNWPLRFDDKARYHAPATLRFLDESGTLLNGSLHSLMIEGEKGSFRKKNYFKSYCTFSACRF